MQTSPCLIALKSYHSSSESLKYQPLSPPTTSEIEVDDEQIVIRPVKLEDEEMSDEHLPSPSSTPEIQINNIPIPLATQEERHAKLHALRQMDEKERLAELESDYADFKKERDLAIREMRDRATRNLETHSRLNLRASRIAARRVASRPIAEQEDYEFASARLLADMATPPTCSTANQPSRVSNDLRRIYNNVRPRI